jgi:hypothetical protein
MRVVLVGEEICYSMKYLSHVSSFRHNEVRTILLWFSSRFNDATDFVVALLKLYCDGSHPISYSTLSVFSDVVLVQMFHEHAIVKNSKN